MSVEVKTGFLPVGIDHQIYFQDVGSASNEALLFVHGGPGTGCEEKHRTQFDLNKYRVVLFDQRGSGKSQTQGEIHENHTEALVGDIEAIRKRLRIEKLTLLGSSWGAVPASAYAALYPDRVKRLILKSPLLARKEDFAWSYTKDGVGQFLPQEWERFSFNSSAAGRTLVQMYYKALIMEDAPKANRPDWICRWLNWEGAQYFFSRPAEQQIFTPQTLTPYWTAVARIQIHYAKNQYFVQEQGILPWIEKISQAGIPGLCLQGIKDIITPPTGAKFLLEKWPAMELRLIPGADHKIPAEELLRI